MKGSRKRLKRLRSLIRGSSDPRSCFALAAGKLSVPTMRYHPLDSTALAAAVSIPGSVEIGNLTPGTDDAGPAKSEGCLGREVCRGKSPHRRGKEFPERSESCERSELCSVQPAYAVWISQYTETTWADSHMALFLVDPTTQGKGTGTIPVTDSDDARGDDIETSALDGILTVKDLVNCMPVSETWVYKHWPELGGVKLGGSIFFPSKEIVYEHIFGKGQRLARGLQYKRGTLHPRLVPIKNKSKAGHDKAAKRAITKPLDPNRHGL